MKIEFGPPGVSQIPERTASFISSLFFFSYIRQNCETRVRIILICRRRARQKGVFFPSRKLRRKLKGSDECFGRRDVWCLVTFLCSDTDDLETALVRITQLPPRECTVIASQGRLITNIGMHSKSHIITHNYYRDQTHLIQCSLYRKTRLSFFNVTLHAL